MFVGTLCVLHTSTKMLANTLLDKIANVPTIMLFLKGAGGANPGSFDCIYFPFSHHYVLYRGATAAPHNNSGTMNVE
jgi:hypothetical protein